MGVILMKFDPNPEWEEETVIVPFDNGGCGTCNV